MTAFSGLLVAVTGHATWNLLLKAYQTTWQEGFVWLDFALVAGMFAAFVGLLTSCLHAESLVVARQLCLEAAEQDFPPAHVALLSRWRRRHREFDDLWQADEEDHLTQARIDGYILDATRLGLRRHQRVLAGPKCPAWIEQDIVEYRERARATRESLSHRVAKGVGTESSPGP